LNATDTINATHVVLIRHGETEWNRAGRIQGYYADSPLTAAGEAQARALGACLAGDALERLYSSDLGRTRQTVAPIAQSTALPVEFDIAFRERSYGSFEGLTYADIERDFPEDYRKFTSRDPAHAAPGGESPRQFHDRIRAALTTVAEGAAGKRIAVVTHGGVLSVMYRLVLGMALDAPRDYKLANASINRFTYAAGKWTLDDWGDVRHLDGNGMDEL
jgi:probable phosphoglycerate mutase